MKGLGIDSENLLWSTASPICDFMHCYLSLTICRNGLFLEGSACRNCKNSVGSVCQIEETACSGKGGSMRWCKKIHPEFLKLTWIKLENKEELSTYTTARYKVIP